jgi:Double zinc ribbon
MFCQKCGCELPAIAKFCSECGSRADLPTAIPEQGSFCVNCGKPYDQSYKFCNYCGHLLPDAHFQSKREPPAREPVKEPSSLAQSQQAQPTVTDNSLPSSLKVWKVPYAAFTLWFLASVGSCSCAFFTAAYAVGRNSFGDITITLFTFSLIATVFLVAAMKRTWNKVVLSESSADAGRKWRRNRILIKAAVLAILFLSMSAGVGYVIGLNGAEAAQVLTDFAQMRTLGDRISKARSPNGDQGIPWYIEMYKSIEPDVTSLDVVLHRLTNEYPSYIEKFPDGDTEGPKTMSDLNIGLRRMALLKQQIAVAKTMGGLSPAEQSSIWTSEMYPLLKEEDALDNTPK